ncbi:hypothetical protein B0F90DRAFT_700465 [Multifurca ochricompacta]|uniref:Uncharacterized protein n=1 Tax=Multifurca ochricompacta TaxID=376703 RepID=A0AAD4M213_9AGAM|nr:hypothetical protein B0F90DRAFT_700465 [Multifurca ochricompacta]
MCFAAVKIAALPGSTLNARPSLDACRHACTHETSTQLRHSGSTFPASMIKGKMKEPDDRACRLIVIGADNPKRGVHCSFPLVFTFPHHGPATSTPPHDVPDMTKAYDTNAERLQPEERNDNAQTILATSVLSNLRTTEQLPRTATKILPASHFSRDNKTND